MSGEPSRAWDRRLATQRAQVRPGPPPTSFAVGHMHGLNTGLHPLSQIFFVIYRCVQYNIYDLIQSTPHQHRSSSISHAAALSNPFMPMPLSPETSAPATSLPGGACRASPGLLVQAAVTPALGPGRRAPGTTPPTHALPCSGRARVATCHAAGEASERGAQAGRARVAAGEAGPGVS